MAQVHVADPISLGARRLEPRGNSAVGRAPGDDQQVAVGIAGRNYFRNILSDTLDFGCANSNHLFMVHRFVVDVTGDVLLLDPADAVFETGRTWNRPWAGQSLRVALIG